MNAPGQHQQIVDAVLAFIAQDGCSDDGFDALAMRLFAYQYANDEPYRRFCQQRGTTPRNAKRWLERIFPRLR